MTHLVLQVPASTTMRSDLNFTVVVVLLSMTKTAFERLQATMIPFSQSLKPRFRSPREKVQQKVIVRPLPDEQIFSFPLFIPREIV